MGKVLKRVAREKKRRRLGQAEERARDTAAEKLKRKGLIKVKEKDNDGGEELKNAAGEKLGWKAYIFWVLYVIRFVVVAFFGHTIRRRGIFWSYESSSWQFLVIRFVVVAFFGHTSRRRGIFLSYESSSWHFLVIRVVVVAFFCHTSRRRCIFWSYDSSSWHFLVIRVVVVAFFSHTIRRRGIFWSYESSSWHFLVIRVVVVAFFCHTSRRRGIFWSYESSSWHFFVIRVVVVVAFFGCASRRRSIVKRFCVNQAEVVKQSSCSKNCKRRTFGHNFISLLPGGNAKTKALANDVARNGPGTHKRRAGGMREKSRQMNKHERTEGGTDAVHRFQSVHSLLDALFLFTPLIALCGNEQCFADYETVFSIFTLAGHLNSMLNPLMYSRFSRDFRKV
ncbi:hypothetical protein niasHT_004285 [Heterodera trifolii]|uniref:G-protein coupled receptors family 1 profile domain-containing protein n=1 Tax=Heterodera trifolii TaxID=157864 RepID=A0ABD2LR65_9BILA